MKINLRYIIYSFFLSRLLGVSPSESELLHKLPLRLYPRPSGYITLFKCPSVPAYAVICNPGFCSISICNPLNSLYQTIPTVLFSRQLSSLNQKPGNTYNLLCGSQTQPNLKAYEVPLSVFLPIPENSFLLQVYSVAQTGQFLSKRRLRLKLMRL